MATAPLQIPEHDIEHGVKAQALVRAKLGFPVLLLMFLAIWYWGPSSPRITTIHIAGMAILYTCYNFAALYFANRLRPFSAWQLVMATAILDPLMLSGWLGLMGRGSSLFVCFYLFTILGFGFRIGLTSMRICQIASLVGFASVVLLSPEWKTYPLVALSQGVFLIVVPIYAATLIKQLRDAREHAERESQAKSQLLANVSHELRTPLSGIVSSAQLIEAETRDPVISKRADAILKLSGELNSEINNLLDSAKYQANLIVLESEPFDLSDLMENLQLALGPTAAIKNIGLLVGMDQRIRQNVMGDAHYLTSVLMNLGGNAVKFTEHGHVEISLTLVEENEESYRLRFGVRDTGIGIAPEMHEKIFDPFYQVSSGTTRKYGGTGLGTSIAKQIVTLMNGDLQIESELGKGSLFWFELSLAKAQRRDDRVDRNESSREIVYGKRILVADDNTTNLLLTKELFKKDRHSVVTAKSGREALDCLNVMAFDAVFLDFNMADMDGAQVFELYRFGKLNTAPTFFLTADTTSSTAKRLQDIGAAGVIHKPVTFEKLRAALLEVFVPGSVSQEVPQETPSSATPVPRSPHHERAARSATLKVVPTEYIDQEALSVLREISTTPEFMVELLSAGIADMERLGQELASALLACDVDAVHSAAHALKGVSLNMGAARLGMLASKLMLVPGHEIKTENQRWLNDIQEAIKPSIDGLRNVLATAA